MNMTYNLGELLFLGLFAIQYVQCQTQAASSVEESLASMSRLKGDIANFEASVNRGEVDAHAHTHGHDGPSEAPHVELPLNTERHSHHVNSVDVPKAHHGPMTDIHGNQAPHPGGVHVDLPNEHGNKNKFPVLHEGSAPIRSGTKPSIIDSAGLQSQLGPPSLDDLIGPPGPAIQDGVHSATGSLLKPSSFQGANAGIKDGFGTGEAMVLSDGFGAGPASVLPNDAASVNPVPSQNLQSHARSGLDLTSLHLDTHVDPPGVHNNNLRVPVIHRPAGRQGFHISTQDVGHIDQPILPNQVHGIGSPVVPDHTGAHVDLPGEHNNDLGVAVVHRPPGSVPPVVPGHTGSHVDLPGVHGNDLGVPVIHRPHGNVPGHTGAHVDLPGMHNNNLGVPVIHRPTGTVPRYTGIHADAHVDHPGHTGAHVDLPGQHNNNMAVPVIHRPNDVGPAVHPGHIGAHVDLPGQHNNNMAVPVIHRPNDVGPAVHQGHTGAHVDLPGQHNNNMAVPVIHRPNYVSQTVHPGHTGAHIDLPGVHNNNMAVPVVHRPSGLGPPGGFGADGQGVVPQIHSEHKGMHTGVHVDLPSVHENNLARPSEIVPPVDPTHIGAHVDLPDVHNNNMALPVVHRMSRIGPSIHPGHKGSHVDLVDVQSNLAVSAINRPSGIGSPFAKDHIGTLGKGNLDIHRKGHVDIHGKDRIDIHRKGPTGIRIVPAGVHGNPHDEPALYLPEGATLADAVAAGVIPPPVPAGVLNGPFAMPKPLAMTGVPLDAKNVPVAPSKRREERRRLRKLERKRQRKNLRKKGKRPSKPVKDSKHKHKHTEPKKSNKVLVIRRRPSINMGGILGNILGSLVAPGPGGPRPMMVRLGSPPFMAPPPQQNPMQNMASSLVRMLMNGVVSG